MSDPAALPDSETAPEMDDAHSLGRRDWVRSAMTAGAVVAGAGLFARASAQTRDTTGADATPPTKVETPVVAQTGGIVLINNKVKGESAISGYKDCIPAAHCSFSSSVRRVGRTKRGGVDVLNVAGEVSDISLTIAGGPWVAELQQAFYDCANLGDVTIARLAIDKNATAAPTTIQKITLTNAVVTSVQQNWDTGDGVRSASISFSFDKILFEVGTKPADFTLKNFTEKAV